MVQLVRFLQYLATAVVLLQKQVVGGLHLALHLAVDMIQEVAQG